MRRMLPLWLIGIFTFYHRSRLVSVRRIGRCGLAAIE
jgi:hypothetical protein